MAGLIGNMLDFSRGRLGGGIPIRRTMEAGLGETLSQIVAELQSVRPDRVIDVDLALNTPVYCDGARMAQLFSNLLGNALTHGGSETPVKVSARTANGVFELSVSNGGPKIPPEAVAHIRYEYAALLTQCDAYLGDVLDVMDEQNLWDDTLLIVWTDHGFLLGEHDSWAKIWMPFYEEVAHTPFFVWDPRSGKRGERRCSLVQPSIDLGPTLLDFFSVERTPDMLGKPLGGVIADDTPVRDAAIFGVHGGQVNVTDGRYVYMHARATDDNGPLYDYTHLPTVMHGYIDLDRLRAMELAPPFRFTKNCPTMKIPAHAWGAYNPAPTAQTRLWDVENDPQQRQLLDDPEVERRMIAHIVRLMNECDAPAEQYERLGLER